MRGKLASEIKFAGLGTRFQAKLLDAQFIQPANRVAPSQTFG